MNSRIGQELGNYQLLQLLGKGGFAEVYLAEHRYLKRKAAVKILSGALADEDLEDFLNEAQTIASFKHPHILPVFDFGVESMTPFLIMEYAVNGTLRKRHPQGTRVPLSTVVGYVYYIAKALQYAHDSRVIHRDIKPDNILLDEQNILLLSDFGIATIAHSTSSIKTLNKSGTPYYMAPEQFQGRPVLASDQYSLAVMVYEWLSGRRPYTGDSFYAIGMQHMTAPIPSLYKQNIQIPEEADYVVGKALAKDPRQRFNSVSEFAQALEHAAQGTVKVLDDPSTLEVSPAATLSHTPLTSVSNTTAEQVAVAAQIPSIMTSGPKRESIHLPSDLPRTATPRLIAILSIVIISVLLLGIGGAFAFATQNKKNIPNSSIATHHSAVLVNQTPSPTPNNRPAPSPTVKPSPVEPTATPVPVVLIPTPTPTPIAVVQPAPSCGAFSDYFNGNLNAGWNWVDPNGQATENITAPGTLTMTTPSQSDLNSTTNTNAPRLLQSINGNFTLQTSLELTDNAQIGFYAAGMLIWQDANNFIRIDRYPDSIDFEQVVNGVFSHNAPQSLAAATILGSKFELQITRSGDAFAAYWRIPGQSWQAISTTILHLQNITVGLALINESTTTISARYHYFKVSCG